MDIRGGDMQLMKIKKFILSIIYVLIVIIYFCNTKIIVQGVKEGLELCYNTIIPSLYIFMVISVFLSLSDYAEFISVPFVPFFRILNIRNKKITTYCVLSMLGGFATGGYFLNRIDQEFRCDKNLKHILTLLTSNNSPAFVITAVGTQMLKSTKTGIIIYFSVLVSGYITAFLLSFLLPYSDTDTICFLQTEDKNITGAIKVAVTSVLNICGVVILSTVICKVTQLYSDFSALSAVFSIFLEVTCACNYITNTYGNNLYLISVAVTVTPLSTYFQMKSFDKNNSYSFKILFLSKLLQVPLCISILRILVNIFPETTTVYSSYDICVNTYWNSPHMSFYLFVLSLCFVIFFDRKTEVFTKSVK